MHFTVVLHYSVTLRRVSTGHAARFIVVRQYVAQLVETEICATLRKNEHDLASVGTSKESRRLHAFSWNRN